LEVRAGSEREVEMHIISPLLEEPGYGQEQEAAGFVMWEGVRQHRVEADLLYFASGVRDQEAGGPCRATALHHYQGRNSRRRREPTGDC
jgi:hypothetical protein